VETHSLIEKGFHIWGRCGRRRDSARAVHAVNAEIKRSPIPTEFSGRSKFGQGVSYVVHQTVARVHTAWLPAPPRFTSRQARAPGSWREDNAVETVIDGNRGRLMRRMNRLQTDTMGHRAARFLACCMRNGKLKWRDHPGKGEMTHERPAIEVPRWVGE